jgi:enoyl-CoA hydratase
MHEFRIDEEAIAHIYLNDGKANVLNDASCAALRDGIAAAGDASARALVIHGKEKTFSAGIDLTMVREPDPAKRASTLSNVAHTMLAVWTAPIPTIAAVTGHAIAGGAILAMACDRRIGTKGPFKLGINETRLKMVFPTWAIVIAKAGLRPSAWNQVILEGKLLSPEEAVRFGILDEAVEIEDHDRMVAELAAELSEIPTGAYAGNKELLRGAEAKRAGALVAQEMGAGFASDQIGQ